MREADRFIRPVTDARVQAGRFWLRRGVTLKEAAIRSQLSEGDLDLALWRQFGRPH